MKRYVLWLRIAIVFQTLTAMIHSIGFFVTPQGSNETENHMLDLMTNFKMEVGLGMSRTMGELTTGLSACFTMIYMLGAIQNWYLLRKKVDVGLLKGMTGIALLIFGVSFVVMIRFTFFLPILCTGLVFLSLLISYLTIPKQQ
jgi:hypothetical protein